MPINKKLTTYIITSVILTALIMPQIILAVPVDPLIGPRLGLGTTDFKTAVINFIQLVLGFLGLIAVIMVLIGGFTWMTSMGDEERVGRAKKTISGAVIGIVLVLVSWSIVTFVINTTNRVTS